MMLPLHLAAGVTSTCDVCGKSGAGTANCCSEGGAWHGNCGDGAEHTWQAGLDVCHGAVQEAAADQTAPGPDPPAGREAEEANTQDASLTCDACGENGAGESNCCSSGGAWQGKCGDGAEHSWQAGFNVCNGAAQEAARDQTAPVADLQCNSDDECYAPKNRCVKQADGEHAQCISCTTAAFQNDCSYWEESDLLPSSEEVCRQKCECPKSEHELKTCTARSRREHRMSSDENVKRSQRRRSPVLGLRADDDGEELVRLASDGAKAYAGAWAKENSWYRIGANGTHELLPTSLSSTFKYDVSMDLVKWTQGNEVEFNCSDGTNRSSGSMLLPGRGLSIVGNGESAIGQGDQIDEASEVARFNLFELTNRTGRRTTIHVINAHIQPEQFQAALVLNLECENPEVVVMPGQGQGTLCSLTPPMRERMCSSDPSRGFLFAAIFHGEDTKLYGFDDGLKHYWDPANTPPIYHEMKVEHAVLRDLGWLEDGSRPPPLKDDSGTICTSVCYGTSSKPVCC